MVLVMESISIPLLECWSWILTLLPSTPSLPHSLTPSLTRSLPPSLTPSPLGGDGDGSCDEADGDEAGN